MSIGLGTAISVYGATSGTAFASSVPAGDVIVVFLKATTAAAPTVTDNVNTGNYTELNSFADSTNGRWMYVFFKQATATGTPTVSVSGPSGNIVIVDFTGFVGTPTADPTPNGGNGSASSATYSITPVDTGFNNCLILGGTSQTSNNPAIASGWTAAGAAGGGPLKGQYAVIATSGTNTPFTGALDTTTAYDAVTAGIYDAPAAATPTVTSVNGGSAFAENATNVAVVGTNFASGMTSQLVQGSISVAQPTTFTSATAATFNATVGTQLAYTDATYVTTYSVTVSGQTSTGIAATITPITGNIFETLASVNAVSADRITATPDLVAGDQLEASGNATGTAAIPTGLSLNNDATYQFASGDTPANFWVRAYDSVNHVWGAWAEQQVVPNPLPASTGGAPFFSLAPGLFPTLN